MDKDKKTLAVVGVLGGLAAVLLLRKKAEAAPQMDAAITIRVLDSAGTEVPHNSPILLDPGEYTVEVTVTNQSLYLGEPTEVALTTRIEAVVNDMELMPPTERTDTYGPDQALIMSWPLIVPFDAPAASGAIVVQVLDPNGKKLAEDSQSIETTGPRREAIDGMGDIDGDGYVTETDVVLVQEFVQLSQEFLSGHRPMSDITPFTSWEFVRRADMNRDGKIDASDITGMYEFMHHGVLPDPGLGSRETINNMGDLDDDGHVNSVDLFILHAAIHGYPSAILSPLGEEEFFRRADMNGDGRLDIRDVYRMLEYIHEGVVPVDYAADLDMGVS